MLQLILEDQEHPVDHLNQEDQGSHADLADHQDQGLPSCQVGR